MKHLVIFTGIVALATGAFAELQNVQVGGVIQFRGRYWRNNYANASGGPREVRIPAGFLPGRSIGPFGTGSRYDFDSRGNDIELVEMQTKLNVSADFTNNVRGFIEFDAFDVWGTDFRSDYITGADFAPVTNNDVEVLQSYIEINEMYGHPLRLRIGRQQMKYGKGWLVGDLIAATLDISFDAVRLTYDTDDFVVDAWWSKLAENGPIEQDGDVDFYGVYGTYKALEPVDISLYWMLVRDGRSLTDTNLTWFPEFIEDVFGLDDYDPTYLHTVGLRAFGATGGFDYDLELAYQFGNAGQVGFGFRPFTYGDDRAKYDAWGGDLEVGYTFDAPWRPRVFLGGAYIGGEDNRDLSFWEWLNPFSKPKASVSFNRMFSQSVYSWLIDVGQDLSNFYQFRAGTTVHPTDSITGYLKVSYTEAIDTFDWPVYVSVGRYRVPVAPTLSFWTTKSDSFMGWSTLVWLRYQYSEDLWFRLSWERLFGGDGRRDGNFMGRNGLEFIGGTDKAASDYVSLEMGISF